MKKTQALLLLVFLLVPALTIAQTIHSVNTVANSQAQSVNARTNTSSNKPQQLRRHNPQMKITEQDFGPDKLSVSFEKGIASSTAQALISYIKEHYIIAQLIISIYKLPSADNLYFVSGTIHKDKQAQESSEVRTIFLVLREQGEIVSEVSKVENDSDAALKEPVFFLGQNKLLAIVSLSAMDGSLAGHYAFEYTDNNLKPLGSIPVIDKLGMSGQVWITNNKIERATAEYKNNTYYVTLWGKGSLYQESGYDKYKRLAPPRSPVAFFYDGKEWRPVATKQIRRS